MENNTIYIVAFIVLFLLVILFLLLRYVTKKFGEEKVVSILSDVKTGIEKLDTTLDSLGPVIPKGVSNIVDTILRYAYVTVSAAEQLYKNGTLKKEERLGYASDKTSKILKLVGVDVTPDIEEVIGTSIEAAVKSLPKTHPIVKVSKTK